MNTRTYKINDLIKNEAGLTLQVQEIDSPSDKTIGDTASCYKTLCKKCNDYTIERIAENLENQKTCLRCLVKSAVLKFDAKGTVSSINGYRLVEYISDFQEKYEVSEHETFDVVIEMVKANRLVA